MPVQSDDGGDISKASIHSGHSLGAGNVPPVSEVPDDYPHIRGAVPPPTISKPFQLFSWLSPVWDSILRLVLSALLAAGAVLFFFFEFRKEKERKRRLTCPVCPPIEPFSGDHQPPAAPPAPPTNPVA